MGFMDDAKKMADDAATKAKQVAADAKEKSGPTLDKAKTTAGEWSDKAKVKAGELGDKAKPTADKAKAEAAELHREGEEAGRRTDREGQDAGPRVPGEGQEGGRRAAREGQEAGRRTARQGEGQGLLSPLRSDALAAGPDGRPRCFWAVGGAEEYIGYHDDEWGRPVLTDDGLFERLTLEAFQSGLSWLTILRKRPAFRAAFAGFDVAAVAAFDDADRDRLLADAGIVRNRLKVDAALANARAALPVIEEHGSLAAFFWRFRPEAHEAPRARAGLGRRRARSRRRMAKELKKRGFRFVGPTTAYSLMQAAGIVNDHAAGCCVHGAVEAEQREAAAGFA